MKRQKDGYSKFISVAKIALPVLAFGLVASIFLSPKTESVQNGLVIADEDFDELAVGQKITGPNFSGVTKDGDAFTLSAEYALPDAPRPLFIDLANTKGSFNFQTGLEIKTSAEKAELNIKLNTARLTGKVGVQSSNGFSGSTEELLVNFIDGTVESPGIVTGTTPFGSLTAGSMITSRIEQSESNLLMFQNGVKLIYLPKQQD